jgi:ribosomal protein L3
MAGRMGNTATQIRNLQIFDYNPETGILRVTGLIPGGRNALATVTVTKAAETK